MNTLTNTRRQDIEEIAALITQGIECWYSAGSKLCRLIDDDPDVIGKICNEVPQLTPGILRQLERIGRKELVPELLLKSGPGWSKLRQMPFPIQKRLMSEPVDLLVLTERGPDTLKVTIDNLTSQQARQVFDDDHVRDASAQRAWIAANAPAVLPPVDMEKPYSIHGKYVIFNKRAKLSVRDIGIILAEING